jgi:hypothetical protein
MLERRKYLAKYVQSNTNVVDDGVKHVNQILDRKCYLYDEHIEKFRRLLKEISNNEFELQYCLLHQIPEMIVPVSPDRDHIQILLIDLGGPVGHRICSYYKKETGEINIYDSATMFSSDSTAAMFLMRLYPTNNNYKGREVQQQDNTYDCGVFAIAFPTTLYSGQDPVGKRYNREKMRQHLVQMLQSKRIEAFPEG